MFCFGLLFKFNFKIKLNPTSFPSLLSSQPLWLSPLPSLHPFLLHFYSEEAKPHMDINKI